MYLPNVIKCNPEGLLRLSYVEQKIHSTDIFAKVPVYMFECNGHKFNGGQIPWHSVFKFVEVQGLSAYLP